MVPILIHAFFKIVLSMLNAFCTMCKMLEMAHIFELIQDTHTTYTRQYIAIRQEFAYCPTYDVNAAILLTRSAFMNE